MPRGRCEEVPLCWCRLRWFVLPSLDDSLGLVFAGGGVEIEVSEKNCGAVGSSAWGVPTRRCGS